MNLRRNWHAIAVAALMLAPVWTGPARGDFSFTAPVKVANVEMGPTTLGGVIAPDGLSMYLASNQGGDFDIYVTKRASTEDPWGTPVNLGPTVNSPHWDHGPTLSPDGLMLLFPSDRPGGSGGLDIWVSTRPTLDAPWGAPVNLGPKVNSPEWDLSPRISADGLSLLFHSLRPGGYGSMDIWMATRATKDDDWGTPVNLEPPINSSSSDGEALLSADGLTLFFNSNRPGGLGGDDMWVATRPTTTSPWGEPVNLGPIINSPGNDWYASFSADGTTLYFSSDRPVIWGPCSPYQTSIVPIVDLNSDGTVDILDLVRLIECWGQHEPSVDLAPPPLGDGIVDDKDVKALMDYWGQETTDPMLVACWKLDETEGPVVADSAGTNHGEVIGNATWRPQGGRVGGALEFDGVDDFIVTSLAVNPSDGAFSIFLWVKGGAPGQAVLSQRAGVNWLAADGLTGALMTDLRSGGRISQTLSSQTTITDGQWHRIGFTWDGVTRTLYADGAVVARDTQDGLKSAFGDLMIGTGNNLAPGAFWSGLLDDVRIYRRVVQP